MKKNNHFKLFLTISVVILICAFVCMKTKQASLPPLGVYVINVDEDKKKLVEFSEHLNNQSIEFKRFPGVKINSHNKQKYIDLGLLNPNTKLKKRGWVGVALAHLALWKTIQQDKSNKKYFLIFEDDEIIHPNYKDKLANILDEIDGDFDFINLNTIRTKGKLQKKNVYKIEKENINYSLMPNIWLSSYIINKNTIDDFFKIMNPQSIDFDTIQFDQFFVKFLHTNADVFNLYTCPRDIISTHIEDRNASVKTRYNK